ncbi:MAG: hypothetical protein GY832_42285 [Chloroflexi bacterium]|nr:hypothetical protein [Chloroflexota bacterium]
MKKVQLSLRAKLFLVLLTLMPLLSACSYQVDRLWLNAPGWSRAQLISDTSINQAISIALDDTGGIYLFSTRKEANGHHPHIIALNRQAEIIWERTLDVVLVKPDQAQIHWDGQALVLFWIDDQSLYAAQVDTSGNLHAKPTLLSREKVGSCDIAARSNSITIWYGGTRRNPGVYTLPFQNPTGEATLVDAEGIHPAAQYDDEGRLHATWLNYAHGPVEPRLYYAAYPGSVYVPEQQILVAEPYIRSDSELQGPWLGLDQQHVYLFLLEGIRSGRGVNKTDVKYVYFPQNEPRLASEPNSIVVPRTAELVYEALPEKGLAAGQRVPLTSG